MQTDNSIDHSLSLFARIEAMLFIASEPVLPSQLANVLGISVEIVEEGLRELIAIYQDQKNNRGLRIQSHRGRYQLTSAPEAAPWIEKFLGLDTGSRLSRAGLEALAIIAYLQPVTRPQIDSIRGVNSDGVLKSLLSKGLIAEAGRAEAVGRPILYITTAEFLQYFGLYSLTELPPLSLERPQSAEEDKTKNAE